MAVDGDGLKMVLKTALHFGHAVSGKSKDQFAKDVRPYLKVKKKLKEFNFGHFEKLYSQMKPKK